jgi:putative oxidoreductase
MVTMLNLDDHSDRAAFVGRLFMSSLFILYGIFSLTNYSGAVAYMAKYGLPSLFAALAVVFELGGGILILIGWQTRWVALALAAYVLIAALIAHAHFGDPSQLVHFMKIMAIIGGLLAFVAYGGGAMSVDARR